MKKGIRSLKGKALAGAGALAMAGGLYAFTALNPTPGYAYKKVKRFSGEACGPTSGPQCTPEVIVTPAD